MGVFDGVAEAIREVVAAVIEPRFGALFDADISEKTPGEVVTTADLEAEHLLTEHLRRLSPNTPVVGEEACSANPGLLRAVAEAEAAWLVDPLDGTANFIRGSTDWATMVAFVRGGTAVASWIWHPASASMYRAERGSGAWRNDTRITTSASTGREPVLRGAVLTGFMDTRTRSAIETNAAGVAELVPGAMCAGVGYPKLISGDEHFAIYWRTLPWDHAPGALLLTEAGGEVRRPDGAEYEPGDGRVGLLAAGDAALWRRAAALLP